MTGRDTSCGSRAGCPTAHRGPSPACGWRRWLADIHCAEFDDGKDLHELLRRCSGMGFSLISVPD